MTDPKQNQEEQFTMETTVDDTQTDYPVEERPKHCHHEIAIDTVISLDDFAAKKKIGEGGSGIVYSGIDPTTGRHVAIKTLKPVKSADLQNAHKLLREAKTTAQLEHPNIVPIHAVLNLDDSGITFTMKLVSGDTLSEILKKCSGADPEIRQKYPPARLLDIFLGICQGIAFAHSRGIIHRDLKPDNIIIGKYGEVLILDWGLAKEVNSAEDPSLSLPFALPAISISESTDIDQTMEGMIKGTPTHMSPEQACARNDQTDQRSDIYSLGVLLYNILTFTMPFKEATLTKLLDAIVVGDFIPPREKSPQQHIPRDLEAICLKAMKLDPQNRYQNVDTLISDIHAQRQNRSVSVYKKNILLHFWKACLRKPVISASILTVVIVAVLFSSIIAAKRQQVYITTIEMAEKHSANARREYATTIDVLKKLKEERKNEIVKTISTAELRLQKELNTSYNVVKSNYLLALNLLAGLKDDLSDDSRIEKDIREILGSQLRHAIITGDNEGIEYIGPFIIAFINERFKTITPDLAEKLTKVEAIVQGKRNVVFKNNTAHKIELWELDSLYHSKSHQIAIPKGTEDRIEIELTKGSYIVKVFTDKTSFFRVPFVLSRETTLKSNRLTIDLTPPQKLHTNFIYIPAGPFIAGGESSRLYRRHSSKTDAFYIQKTEVSFEEYRLFWKALSLQSEKKSYLPKILFKQKRRAAWNTTSAYLVPDIASTPVRGITYAAAQAYAKWYAKTRHVPARLPSATEWEKAARGCDGRTFPWGNWTDKKMVIVASADHSSAPLPVGSNPMDRSVYGVLDMGGNVREMTSSTFPDNPRQKILKGASFESGFRLAPCAAESHTGDFDDEGFRLLIESP